MTNDNTTNLDTPSTVLSELGIPAYATLPAVSIGLFTFNQDQFDLPIGERDYHLHGVLTSEGWVPPAPRSIAHLLGQTGTSPHDIDALNEYTTGKRTRLAIELEEFDESLTDKGSVELNENAWSLLGSPFQGSVEYYVPKGLPQEQLAEYLEHAVSAAEEYARSQVTENPSENDIVGILTETYGITQDTAIAAVKMVAARGE